MVDSQELKQIALKTMEVSYTVVLTIDMQGTSGDDLWAQVSNLYKILFLSLHEKELLNLFKLAFLILCATNSNTSS